MLTVANCKSIWRKIPQNMKTPFLFLPVTLPAFFMPPTYIEKLSFTGYEDKLFHLLFFAGLAYLFAGRKSILVITGLFLLGTSIELLQALLPHRGASLSDVFANCLGLLAGITLRYLKA